MLKKLSTASVALVPLQFVDSLSCVFTGSVNFLTADGLKFTHPLHHLGKTSKDLPVLAIDSFQHMYIWKQDPKTDLRYLIFLLSVTRTVLLKVSRHELLTYSQNALYIISVRIFFYLILHYN